MKIKQFFCRHKWEHLGIYPDHNWEMYESFQCKKCRKYKSVKLIKQDYSKMNFKIKM